MTATQRPTSERLPRSGVPAPARPRSAPRPAPLRVVRAAELSPAGLRRRRRLVVGGTGALVVTGLFAVVVVHVVLAQQQFQLASVNSRISAQTSLNDQLRLQVAQLQAPERVVSEARKQLGMVSPPSITYLVPGHPGPRVRAQPAPSSTTASTTASTTTASTTATPSTTSTTRP